MQFEDKLGEDLVEKYHRIRVSRTTVAMVQRIEKGPGGLLAVACRDDDGNDYNLTVAPKKTVSVVY